MSKHSRSTHKSSMTSRLSLSSSSRKSLRTSSRDTPSATSNNAGGKNVLNDRLRSVISHPLGLPLAEALHGNDPDKLLYLRRRCRAIAMDNLDKVLKDSILEWRANSRKEPDLTYILSEKIMEESKQTGLLSDNEKQVTLNHEKSKGGIDVLLSSSKKKPLAVIEVGLNNSEWWKKFQQGTKYIDALFEHEQKDHPKCVDPLLVAALTIPKSSLGEPWESKFGVFLCVPPSDTSHATCRIILLWHTRTSTLEAVSEAFGRFLRITASFADWRQNAADEYQYFSSSCCGVGKHILRCYDSRFRPTDRSPEIYLEKGCKEIIGGEVKEVTRLPVDYMTNDITDLEIFWTNSDKKNLLIISVPYKIGSHLAKSPTDFLPIIRQLQQLHGEGFVHGDIRAFNVVFGDSGGLIDFDFSGKPGKPYPAGYKQILNDGYRIGSGEGGHPHQKLAFWHDWYALGRLMFYVHWIEYPPSARAETIALVSRAERQWKCTSDTTTEQNIDDLIPLLRRLQHEGCKMMPEDLFKNDVDAVLPRMTKKGATGSPLEKKSGIR